MKNNIVIIIAICFLMVLSACTETSIVGDVTFESDNSKIITASSTLEDFYGKPSVILFGATYCSHCQAAVPIFKEQVYEVYKEDVNIWINIVDKGLFDIEGLPQGFNPNLVYNQISSSQCNYVPSWVILDKFGQVALKSCGSEKEMQDMINKLEELI